jgi:hypothetical protein
MSKPRNRYVAISCPASQRTAVIAALPHLGLEGYWMPHGDRARIMIHDAGSVVELMRGIAVLSDQYELQHLD